MTGTMGLLEQLRTASTLSPVFADVFIEKACEMADRTPVTLRHEDLPVLLTHLERALAIFLHGDRYDEAVAGLRALAQQPHGR